MPFEIKQGDSIPIQLQLYDGAKSLPKRVFVELSRPDGSLIEPRFEIPHILNGDFRDNTRVMTNDRYLTAQYFVYEADGTTQDEDYIINKDIFMRDITGELVEDLEIAAPIEITGTLEGEMLIVEDTSGTIAEQVTLEGTVKEDYTITGEVENE